VAGFTDFHGFPNKTPPQTRGRLRIGRKRVRPTRQLILIGNRFDELLKHDKLLASGEQFIPESLPCDILAPAKNRGEEVGDGVPGQVGWLISTWQINLTYLAWLTHRW